MISSVRHVVPPKRSCLAATEGAAALAEALRLALRMTEPEM